MATRSIRLEFIPMPKSTDTEEWTRTCDVPASLLAPLHVQSTPAHNAQIRSTMSPILSSYQSEANTKAGPLCPVCDSQTTLALLRPVAFLHLDSDPYITVYVLPTCGKKKCQERSKEIHDEVMDKTLKKQQDELMLGRFCSVCGTENGTKKCAKCKVSSYCSKEHQKRHWKTHKDLCFVSQCMREVTEGQRVW
ncbi:hypothetical protein EJ02DRAFT_457871 [Clathrospora elynae]|uniref:MYND-type domain-containing protein n=1 Tax=Clathrospora elynae TaxID=706981 RepID=A0A6A5SIY8_9PLEO|nr:hypothetical protein EJ02DRAFT_457871 [Clathrospora elynae]